MSCIHETNLCLSHSDLFFYFQEFLYPYGTAVFIVSGALLWAYLFIYLPETKGQSIDNITAKFQKRTKTT